MSKKALIVATTTMTWVISFVALVVVLQFYSGRVQGTYDMSPTILKDARMIVRWIGGEADLEHGELVVYEAAQPPGELFVKRVCGLPGDTVEIRAGILYRDGEAIHEPYATHELLEEFPSKLRRLDPEHDNFSPVVVSAGSVFLLGDHRSISWDSRRVGPVLRSSVRGRVVYIENP